MRSDQLDELRKTLPEDGELRWRKCRACGRAVRAGRTTLIDTLYDPDILTTRRAGEILLDGGEIHHVTMFALGSLYADEYAIRNTLINDARGERKELWLRVHQHQGSFDLLPRRDKPARAEPVTVQDQPPF